MMIKAKAFKDGMTDSEQPQQHTTSIFQERLRLQHSSLEAAPTLQSQNVVISCSTADVIIRYTVDGSEPSSFVNCVFWSHRCELYDDD